MRSRLIVLALALLITRGSLAHDIPDANVNRSIQVVLSPGQITIDYEVGLSDLTLTQDLRTLLGELPVGGRPEWLARYGKETGPLNARGLILTINGERIELIYVDHACVATDEPTFLFHFKADIPAEGKLRLIDSNYASAEGTSRLAIRGTEGVELKGDSQPTEVAKIVLKPVWQLSREEERRSKRVEVHYKPRAAAPASSLKPRQLELPENSGKLGLTPLGFWIGIWAFGLGFTHSSTCYQSRIHSSASACVQFAFLTSVAILLWWVGVLEYVGTNVSLRHLIGFALGVVGFWQLGSQMANLVMKTDLPHSTSIGFVLVPSRRILIVYLLTMCLGRVDLMMIVAGTFSIGSALREFMGNSSKINQSLRLMDCINAAMIASMGAIIFTSTIETLR